METYKTIQIGKIKTSKIELIDILKAWLVLSLAFAFVLSNTSLLGGTFSHAFSFSFLVFFLFSLFTAGLGFLLHELAHKFVAQHYGCLAEFRAFDQMLYLALGLAAAIGFIFAAPGAVMIAGRITLPENGKISLAGPLTNYILGLLFLGLMFLFPSSLLNIMFWIGFQVNLFLGLFNLIPFWNFDGKKILDWNRYVWSAMLVVGILLIWVLPKYF